FTGGLYIGGLFTAPGGYANLTYTYGVNYGYDNNPNDAVLAMTVNGNRLYYGGNFTHVQARNVNHLFTSDYLDPAGGVDGAVLALDVSHGEVNAGGTFSSVGGGALLTNGWARFSETGVPWVVTQPPSQSVSSGSTVTFTSRPAMGYGGLTLQW